MRVVFAHAAEAELETIGDHIALSNPARAVRFVQELRGKCMSLADLPHGFPLLPHRPASGIRRRIHGNYLIFYRVEADAIEILHVLHGAMDYGSILFPEG